MIAKLFFILQFVISIFVKASPVLKYFSSAVKSINLLGNVNVLACDIQSPKLLEELLCGMDSKLSTNKVVIYSGYIDIIPGGAKEVNIFCVDLIMDNVLESLNSNYLWQGKCFHNNPSASEILFSSQLALDENEEKVVYTMKVNDNLKMQVNSPPLSSGTYLKVTPSNLNVTTAHIHRHNTFYDDSVGKFCDTNEMASIMNINFVGTEQIYYSKIDNKDVYLSPDFFTLFGFENQYSTADLANCWNSYLIKPSIMDVFRAIYVDEASYPPEKGEMGMNKLSDFPKPFDQLGKDFTEFAYLDTNQYNWNDEMMDLINKSTMIQGTVLNVFLIIAFLFLN